MADTEKEKTKREGSTTGQYKYIIFSNKFAST